MNFRFQEWVNVSRIQLDLVKSSQAHLSFHMQTNQI